MRKLGYACVDTPLGVVCGWGAVAAYIEGTIDGTAVTLVEKALVDAEARGLPLEVVLNTYGGYIGPMDRIVELLLNAKVPTYTSREGGRPCPPGRLWLTARWGVKVTAVEIREIIPPADVHSAMVKQIAAERERRAMITQADGERQAVILKAEGERQAAILKAQGQAKALELIEMAASRLGHNAILLQYLEALKAMATSPSTKIVIPMELLQTLQTILKR